MNKKKMNIHTMNTILNFIFRLINMFITYLTIPLTLRYLNNERYGIWQTILTIISWAALSNFGIGNGLRNKVTEAITARDNKRLKGYITNAYVYLSIISVFIFILGMILIRFINTNIIFKNNTLKENEILICFFIIIVSFCINFVLAISSSIALGIHKSSLVNLFQVITNILILIGLVILEKLTKGDLINIALLYLFSNCISNFIFTIYIIYDKKYRPDVRYYNRELGKELTSLGIKFFVLQLATIMLFSTDNFIISTFIGVNEVGDYSIVSKLFQLVATIFSIVLVQLWSGVTEANFRHDYRWIRKMINLLLIALFPVALILTILVFKLDFITQLWILRSLNVSSNLASLCAIYSWLICLNGIYVYVQNGMSKIRVQMITNITAFIMNIPLALIFVRKFNLGVEGVMLSNIICILFITVFCCIDIEIFLNKKLKINLEDSCLK